MKKITMLVLGILFLVPSVSFAQTSGCVAPYSDDKNYKAEESLFQTCVSDYNAEQFNTQQCTAKNTASSTYAWDDTSHVCDASCNEGYYGTGDCRAYVIDLPAQKLVPAPVKAVVPVVAPIVAPVPTPIVKPVSISAPKAISPAKSIPAVTAAQAPVTAPAVTENPVPAPAPIQETKRGLWESIISFFRSLF